MPHSVIMQLQNRQQHHTDQHSDTSDSVDSTVPSSNTDNPQGLSVDGEVSQPSHSSQITHTSNPKSSRQVPTPHDRKDHVQPDQISRQHSSSQSTSDLLDTQGNFQIGVTWAPGPSTVTRSSTSAGSWGTLPLQTETTQLKDNPSSSVTGDVNSAVSEREEEGDGKRQGMSVEWMARQGCKHHFSAPQHTLKGPYGNRPPCVEGRHADLMGVRRVGQDSNGRSSPIGTNGRVVVDEAGSPMRIPLTTPSKSTRANRLMANGLNTNEHGHTGMYMHTMASKRGEGDSLEDNIQATIMNDSLGRIIADMEYLIFSPNPTTIPPTAHVVPPSPTPVKQAGRLLMMDFASCLRYQQGATLEEWQSLIKRFFTPDARFELSLYPSNADVELYDLPSQLLPVLLGGMNEQCLSQCLSIFNLEETWSDHILTLTIHDLEWRFVYPDSQLVWTASADVELVYTPGGELCISRFVLNVHTWTKSGDVETDECGLLFGLGERLKWCEEMEEMMPIWKEVQQTGDDPRDVMNRLLRPPCPTA
ncbi:hypothetical protein M231_04441 [Tremella mesenterica]|uniref:Uncharacterized protein n=1 Tax=Tremella mesenterica TaxID=5217 RepID=A0A4Q1BKE9_TREME|nr:hypothetical protein M231_04441 [Tremella mesenterica]